MSTLSVKGDPEVKIWADRIERGKKLRAKKKKEVKVFLDFYKSLQWGNRKVSLKHKPTVNLIFAHIKTQLPFLYYQNPKWFVNPVKRSAEFDVEKNAETAQIYLNYYARENAGSTLKKQMRLAILDAFFWFGAIKTGYVADFEPNTNYGKYKILGYKEDEPIYDIDDESHIFRVDDVKEYPVNEKFVSRRVTPAAFIFDTECDNYFEDGRFIIQEMVKPLIEVKKDERYINTKTLKENFLVKVGLNIDEKTLREDEEYSGLEDDLKRVTLYEIYDREHDKLKVMAEGHDYWLRNEEIPEGIDKDPYSFILFNTVPDEVYPIADLRPLIPIQEEYNIGRGMIMEHAKRFARKYGYVDGMIDDDEMSKLQDPADGTFFKVKDLPLSGVIEPLQDAPLDSAVYTNFEQSKQDFREVGGATEQDRGIVERRKTAYEAAKMSEATSIRKDDRKSLVEDFAAMVGKKTLQSMQANLTIEDAVYVGGEDKSKQWRKISKEEICGEFNTTVETGSAAPNLPEYERSEIQQLIQSLAGFPPEMIQTEINLGGLLRAVAKTFHTMDADDILNPPEVRKQKQEEMQKQKQVAALLEMRGQDNKKQSKGKE